LKKQGVVHAAGEKAFRERNKDRSGAYAYQNRDVPLGVAYEKALMANKRAWTWLSSQPSRYRRLCALWVMDAKREETRERRLAILIECSAKGEKIPLLR
jgi:hypothetical protein